MKKAVVGLLAVAVLFVLSSYRPTYADGVSQSEIDAAVKKACEWLKSQQRPDGHWEYDVMKPFCLSPNIKMWDGCTALALLALLKGGVDPDEECIRKGFAYIRSQKYQWVYSVAIYVLALEALYNAKAKKRAEKKAEKAKKEGKKGMTEVADDPELNPPKAKWDPADRKAAMDAIAWLIKVKNKRIWRYPMDREGVSNTQYAMLAFAAAQRLKIPVPRSLYWEVANYFLVSQEPKGPEVKGFPVPIADLPWKQLKKIRSDLLKRVKKAAKEAKKMKVEFDPKKYRTEVLEPEARRKLFGGEPRKMWARGWCYMYDDTRDKRAWRFMVTGAMTASGIAALAVCKAGLEGSGGAKFNKQLDQAIRDGCAWIAKHFSVSNNPNSGIHEAGKKLGLAPISKVIHHYYWLYALERIGILCLVRKFGEHDWYEEGAKFLLSAQNGDGSWNGGDNGTSGPVPDTCWAILYLKRATTPLVGLPKEIYSGEDVLGRPAPKEEK